MTLSIALATILAAATQGTPGAPPAADEGWKDVDHVVLIVNEDSLTSWKLYRLVARAKRENPRVDEKEAARKISMDLRNRMISVQSGEDMGMDPNQVEHTSKDVLDREMERFGTAREKSDYLQSHGDLTLIDRQKYWTDMIHARKWEASVTGEGTSADQTRPSRDRYVSPSYQRFAYINYVQHPESLEAIGGQPRKVVLQQLVIDAGSAGGAEAAHELALQLRQRILDGEDMADLVEKYSMSKENRGILEPLPEGRLASFDPGLGAFLAQAKPGDLSEVLTVKFSGERVGLRLARLVERMEPVVPGFDSPEMQQKLTERIRSDLDDARLEEAYATAFRASYVWPPELAARR